VWYGGTPAILANQEAEIGKDHTGSEKCHYLVYILKLLFWLLWRTNCRDREYTGGFLGRREDG
jgi:hypothetical protein